MASVHFIWWIRSQRMRAHIQYIHTYIIHLRSSLYQAASIAQMAICSMSKWKKQVNYTRIVPCLACLSVILYIYTYPQPVTCGGSLAAVHAFDCGLLVNTRASTTWNLYIQYIYLPMYGTCTYSIYTSLCMELVLGIRICISLLAIATVWRTTI